MDISVLQSATDQKYVSEVVLRSMVLISDFILVSKEVRDYEWICVAHTGIFCAHVVGSVTVVELNFVTLIRPESELLEGVLETDDVFPAPSLTDGFVVECALAVRDGLLVDAELLVDGFNGLDMGFLPDERSAKRTV